MKLENLSQQACFGETRKLKNGRVLPNFSQIAIAVF